jgi:hypothetical protein
MRQNVALLHVARDYALSAFERHAPIGAWVIDDIDLSPGAPPGGDAVVGAEPGELV